jgi:excinuclease UvrABC nuclease subunit
VRKREEGWVVEISKELTVIVKKQREMLNFEMAASIRDTLKDLKKLLA